MTVTPWTGGHRPRETREPGEATVCRPVQPRIGPLKRDHLELVPVRVFQQLDVNPAPSELRAVAAAEREPTRVEPDVRAARQLVPAGATQYQGGCWAAVPLGRTRVDVHV